MIGETTTTFALKSWDEKTWDGRPHNAVTGTKVTRATVKFAYAGVIEGEGTVEYTMYYREDGTGVGIALQRVVGTIEGRSGSFMIQHNGTFNSTGVKEQWVVVPDSGTEGLRGLRGAGTISLEGHMERYPLHFTYSFE